MARGLAKEQRPQKKTGQTKSPRTLSESKQKSLSAIKTAGDLSKLLNKYNIARTDIDDLLSEIIEEDFAEYEDTVLGDEPDNYDLKEEYNELDDDYTEYDENDIGDPFDVEGKEDSWGGPLYIAAVNFLKGEPVVEFVQVPQYDTNDPLIKNALLERYALFCEISEFIACSQKAYFRTKDDEHLSTLNQQDLVEHFKKKKRNLSKEHIARMLDVLYFKVAGIGVIASKYFFKRYGHKTGLSQDEKMALAKEFLTKCDKGLKQIEKARRLVEFIEKKKGIIIKMSDNISDHNKFKQWKSIIQRAEDAKGQA